MVTVISGANDATAELAGQTVAQVRAQFTKPLSIPAGAKATVNGGSVSETYVLRDGDNLSFTKNTAEKG